MKAPPPKRRRPPAALWVFLGLLAGAAFLAYLGGAAAPGGIFTDPEALWRRLGFPLLRLTFFISLGLFAGQVIEALGWTDRLAVLARPFMRRAHVSPHMGAAFTTAFVSGTASLSMLMEFYREGLLKRREISLSVLLNTFPSFFLHLPTTFFLVLPLVGKAGLLYLLLGSAAALLRLAAALTACKLLLPPVTSAHRADAGKRPEPFSVVLGRIGGRFRARILRILLVVIPVYLVVLAAADLGLFSWLRQVLARHVDPAMVPIEAFSVVVFSLTAEFTSGYAAAGAMLDSGALTVTQTALALLAGNILGAPVRALRHQMPYYMGIFTPKLGLWLMAATQGFRILSLLAVGAVFVLLAC